ncbi:hypothetical protein HMI55_003495 [Coelomomyces lativittatus]|nr:hypothetical protein HMI55_003495 [Coelomomyces lativittatus]
MFKKSTLNFLFYILWPSFFLGCLGEPPLTTLFKFSASSNTSISNYPFLLVNELDEDINCQETCIQVNCHSCPRPTFNLNVSLAYLSENPNTKDGYLPLEYTKIITSYIPMDQFRKKFCFCECGKKKEWPYADQREDLSNVLLLVVKEYSDAISSLYNLQSTLINHEDLHVHIVPSEVSKVTSFLESRRGIIDYLQKKVKGKTAFDYTMRRVVEIESDTRNALKKLFDGFNYVLSGSYFFDKLQKLPLEEQNRRTAYLRQVAAIKNLLETFKINTNSIVAWINSIKAHYTVTRLQKLKYKC